MISLPNAGAAATAASGARFPVVIAGHVDHGKSTLVGRLLAETGSVPSERIAAVRAHCMRTARPFEYAFLVDALKEERSQGVTIAAARTFFESPRRKYMLLDVPGHLQFLKSMVSGAARADAAVLVIDARDGIGENSKRHGQLLSILGVTQVVVAVTKMDLVGFSRERYDSIVDEFGRFLRRLPLQPQAFVPVSATEGDNVANGSGRLAWYSRGSLLDALDGFCDKPTAHDAPLRLPVQSVYKFTERGDDRRIVAGTLASGRLREGDEVAFYPSGGRTRIRRIEAFGETDRSTASAGDATGVTLADDIFVTRGDVMARVGDAAPCVSTRLRTSVFWLGKGSLELGKEYVIRVGTARVTGRVETFHSVIDATDLAASGSPDAVRVNEIADCTFALSRMVAFDPVGRIPEMERFVIIDNHEIAGGGTIRALVADRAASLPRGIGPAVIWLTGLSGAGKSTIASALHALLRNSGERVEYLDGDAVRLMVPTGFSKEDRDAHVRRVGFLASRLEEHGVITICALVSPYAAARSEVRAMCRRFIEVHVDTPLHECERRDPKGLYARARLGEIANMTGIQDPYEPPPHANVVIQTLHTSVDDAVQQILRALPEG